MEQTNQHQNGQSNATDNTMDSTISNTTGDATDRATGEGRKETVSRSRNIAEDEDIQDTDQLNENQKNTFSEEDAGTGLGADRKQRRG